MVSFPSCYNMAAENNTWSSLITSQTNCYKDEIAVTQGAEDETTVFLSRRARIRQAEASTSDERKSTQPCMRLRTDQEGMG